MKRVVCYILLMVSLVCPAGLVFAESNELPEPLVGQAVVISPDNSKLYFGVAGNEAIFNYDPNFLLGFLPDQLLSCNGLSDLKAIVPFCYAADKMTGAYIMNSRTVLNGSQGLEIAALYWGNSVIGDVYSSGSYMDNFAFYGNNLYKSAADLYADYYTWGTKNYIFNKQAQSYLGAGDSGYYATRVDQLMNEAPDLSNAILTSASGIYLQANSATSFNSSNDGAGSSPEGKIWKSNRALSIPAGRTVTYRGKGTVIINGNLTLGSGAKIIPPVGEESNNSMGIIVKGDVFLSGNNIVKVPILAVGNTTVNGDINVNGNNVFLYGSYVANQFNIASTRQGVRFFYDYRLDSGWPPGFRYFNMPTAKNASQ